MKTSFENIENDLPPSKQMEGNILEDDFQSKFPREGIELLDNGELLHLITPRAFGGKLTSIENLFFCGRAISRRNITTAIAFGQSFLGSLSVWISGNDEQKKEMASLLLAGGSSCLALTEKEFGSDISATQMIRDENGLLSGEKWLINNATRGKSLTVLFNTSKGLSIGLINKSNYDPTYISNIPKIKTHGIKGADISGISFNKLPLSENAIIHREGKGLEVVAKTMQISRTLCSLFSIGALDSCLRMVIKFSCERKLYGKAVMQLDGARSLINKAFYRHLANEAIAHTISRSITLYPQGMSIYSALSKYQITHNTDEAISFLGEVLGARSYILEQEFPLFEKFKRDHSVVGIFDGSSAVNLFVIAGQFGNILKHLEAEASDEFLTVFQKDKVVPDFSGEGLKLTNRGFDFIFKSFCAVKDKLPKALTAIIQSNIDELIKALKDNPNIDAKSYKARKLAQKYCEVASVCIYSVYHLENRSEFGFSLDTDDLLIQVCLEILNGDQLDYHALYLQKYTDEGYLFSHYEMKINE